MKTLFVLGCSLMFVLVCAQPGLKVRVNQRGINFIRDLSLSTVESRSIGFPLTDVAESLNNGLFSIEQSLTGMSIESFKFVEATLEAHAPNILLLNASSVTSAISGDYNYSVSIGTSSSRRDGAFTADLDICVLVTLQLEEINGQFLSSIKSCLSIIHAIDLPPDVKSKISAGVQKDLVTSLELEFCDSLAASLNTQLNALVGISGMTFALLNGTSIDLSLYGPPTASLNRFDVKFDGRCFPDRNPNITYPISRSSLPLVPESNAMGQMFVSDYVIKTFLHALFLQDTLNLEIDLANIKLPFGIQLNTDNVGFFIPGIRRLGAGRPLQFRLVAIAPPKYSQTASGFIVIAQFCSVISVVQANGNIAEAFVLTTNATATGTIIITDATVISIKIADVDFPVAIKSSNVGSFSVASFNLFLGFVKSTIISTLNDIIPGVAIPSAFGFGFENVEFVLHPTAIELRGDIVPEDS